MHRYADDASCCHLQSIVRAAVGLMRPTASPAAASLLEGYPAPDAPSFAPIDKRRSLQRRARVSIRPPRASPRSRIPEQPTPLPCQCSSLLAARWEHTARARSSCLPAPARAGRPAPSQWRRMLTPSGGTRRVWTPCPSAYAAAWTYAFGEDRVERPA